MAHGFKSQDEYNEYMKTYNREYRKRQREKAALLAEDSARALEIIRELAGLSQESVDKYISSFMRDGLTRKEAEARVKLIMTPEEERPSLQVDSSETETDSSDYGPVEPVKIPMVSRPSIVTGPGEATQLQRCIGVRLDKHPGETIEAATKSCEDMFADHSYKHLDSNDPKWLERMVADWDKREMAELSKPQALKDAEKRARIIKVLKDSQDLLDEIDSRERRELALKIQAAVDLERKEFDERVQHYVQSRGISEEEATELVRVERKHEEDLEVQRAREFRRKWEKLTPEQQEQYKLDASNKAKKLVEGSR